MRWGGGRTLARLASTEKGAGGGGDEARVGKGFCGKQLLAQWEGQSESQL
jgi:hypothetical protein